MPPDYDHQFETVRGAKRAIERDLLDKANVFAVSVGPKLVDGERTDTLAITVHVTDKVSVDDLGDEDLIPPTITLETGEVIETDVKEGDIPSEDSAASYPPREGYHRPVFGGVSGYLAGHSYYGTIAGPFERSDGTDVLLTNHHVAASGSGSTIGEDFTQPGAGPVARGVVGTVAELSEWDPDAVNYSDSALIEVSSSVDLADHVASIGEIGDPEPGTPSFEETYLMSGVRSGTRSSPLVEVDYSGWVNHSDTPHYYEGLILFEDVSDGGDSGSLWGRYDSSEDTYHPVGLHFAGGDNGSVAVPWSAIEDAHGVLSPIDTANHVVPVASEPTVEVTPQELETNDNGELECLVARYGDPDNLGEDEVEIRTTNNSLIDTQTITSEWGDVEIVRFDVHSELGTGDATVVLDPENGTTYEYDITVTEPVTDSGPEPTEPVTRTLTTNSLGRATTNLPDGTYPVTVSAPDFEAFEATITVDSAASYDYALTPTDTGGTPTTPVGEGVTLRWNTEDWSDTSSREGIVTSPVGDRDGSLQLGWEPTEPPFSTSGTAYWSMDTSNDIVDDEIGSATGVANGASSTGISGVNRAGGLTFDGTDDHILISDASSLQSSGSFTIAALIYPDQYGGPHTIFRDGFTEPGTKFMEIRDANRVSFGFYDSSNTGQFSSTLLYDQMPDNEWVLLCGSFNGSRLRVWANGLTDTYSVSASRPSRSGSHVAGIGRRVSNDDRPYDGRMSDVALFNRELTTEECQQLYDSLFEGELTTAGLVI